MSEEISEAAKTTALLEKLTQLVTLQQNQIISLQQPQTITLPAATVTEAPIHPNPISTKLDDTNYTLWSQAVRLYVKGRDKMKTYHRQPFSTTTD